MPTMISEAYDASSAPENKTREAAEAIAAFETRFARIEGDLNVIKRMNGVTWAFCLGILFKLLLH